MKTSALRKFANMVAMVLVPILTGCLQMAETCDGKPYNYDTEFCHNDVIYGKCDGGEYNPSAEFCSGSSVYSKCGGSEYSVPNQRCESNVVESKCGNSWYDSKNSNLRCQNNVIETKCGTSNWYNSSTHFCVGSTTYSKCGGDDYDPSAEFCSGSSVYGKCGGSDYNSSTHFCVGNTTYSKCGGDDYDPSAEFCSGSSVYGKCDDRDYNPSTDFCVGNTTYSKCGGDDYYPSAEFCSGNSVYGKCGGTVTYSPSTESCCGDNKYAISTQRCEGDVVESKCGSNGWYNPSTEFCSNGTVKNYGSVIYQGKTYKTVEIGEQVWMAENLNYDATGSKCYNNNESNCATYGRLYDWATAMALPSSCNGSNCSQNANHRGICPPGWHIPSEAEWDVLMTAVGGSSTARTKLKATSGWNSGGNGTDAYGFAALPGGYGDSDGSFDYVGDYGLWWSSSEINANNAYRRDMDYRNEGVGWNLNVDKSNLYSVRCLQD